MISFPNAKINLGLHVVEKRQDGYHNLETIFYPVQLKDALEIVEANQFTFTSSGLKIDRAAEHNLVVKAYQLLKADFKLPPIKIHLHKVIPFGAGLGGGSSDAAFMLKMLNELFELNLSVAQLESYAGRLGADCPFFIKNKAVYAQGIGDQFSPIELDLKGYHIVIIKPPIAVSTFEAYGGIKPKVSKFDLTQINSIPVSDWKEYMLNDFEEVVFKTYPEIAKTKGVLYENGAVYSSMSGSGSAVFAIFDHLPAKIDSLFPSTNFIYRSF